MRNVQEYFRPESAEEAIALKKRFGAEAVYLGGGSDLMVLQPPDVRVAIDIRHAGIGDVVWDGDDLVIGGGALLRTVEQPAAQVAGGMLRDAVRHTAPWLIRNAATLAGNIANASPAADSIPPLMALDAQLELMDGEAGAVPVADVLLAPHRTSLGDNLIGSIRIPSAAGTQRGAFIKLARSESDIALVNVAVVFHWDEGVAREVRIALGAVAPVPMRARETEMLLEGTPLDEDVLAEAERMVRSEVRPISDWRASEEYRRRMCGVLVRRAIVQAVAGSASGGTG